MQDYTSIKRKLTKIIRIADPTVSEAEAEFIAAVAVSGGIVAEFSEKDIILAALAALYNSAEILKAEGICEDDKISDEGSYPLFSEDEIDF